MFRDQRFPLPLKFGELRFDRGERTGPGHRGAEEGQAEAEDVFRCRGGRRIG